MEVLINANGKLLFEGYDVGKMVGKTWGSTEYEYKYSVEPQELEKLYHAFNLRVGDTSGLLQSIKERFSVNEAYSLFGQFMRDHDVRFDSFIWP